MPYALSFKKPMAITDREQYFNDCCIGGDAIVDHLLPAIRARYTDVQSNQEDWGWFIWFRKGRVGFAIDVFTDDPDSGAFRIHLTSRIKRLLVLETVADAPELEDLRALLLSELSGWVNGSIQLETLDPRDV